MPKKEILSVMMTDEIVLKRGEEQKQIKIPEGFEDRIKPFKLKLLGGKLLTADYSFQRIEVPIEEWILIEMERNHLGKKLKHTLSREFPFEKSPFLIKTAGNRQRKIVVGYHENRPIYLFVKDVTYNKYDPESVVLGFEFSLCVESKTLFEKLISAF